MRLDERLASVTLTEPESAVTDSDHSVGVAPPEVRKMWALMRECEQEFEQARVNAVFTGNLAELQLKQKWYELVAHLIDVSVCELYPELIGEQFMVKAGWKICRVSRKSQTVALATLISWEEII